MPSISMHVRFSDISRGRAAPCIIHGTIDRLRINDDDGRHLEDVIPRLVLVKVPTKADRRPHGTVEVEVLLGIHHLLDLGCEGAPALALERLALPVDDAHWDRRFRH